MKRVLTAFVVLMLSGLVLNAQDTPEAPLWDASKFVRTNHLHQISGLTTMAFAGATGLYGASLVAGFDLPGGRDVHELLARGTVVLGAATLGLGLTAYADQLDQVWPHAALMAVAETGWILNNFVWVPGSVPHQITGAVSIGALAAGFVTILLIYGQEN